MTTAVTISKVKQNDKLVVEKSTYNSYHKGMVTITENSYKTKGKNIQLEKCVKVMFIKFLENIHSSQTHRKALNFTIKLL